MKSLSEQLVMYAKYHRDPRNIITHFIGIPMIVFAVAILLSKPTVMIGAFTLSPALVVVVLICAYYLRLSVSIGMLMSALMAACLYFAASFAALEMLAWLAWGIGLFVVGWVFQFVGHFYEGKKPAFVDDLSGLAIGPLFVVSELLFMLGMYASLKDQVEAEAGIVQHQTGPQAQAKS